MCCKIYQNYLIFDALWSAIIDFKRNTVHSMFVCIALPDNHQILYAHFLNPFAFPIGGLDIVKQCCRLFYTSVSQRVGDAINTGCIIQWAKKNEHFLSSKTISILAMSFNSCLDNHL